MAPITSRYRQEAARAPLCLLGGAVITCTVCMIYFNESAWKETLGLTILIFVGFAGVCNVFSGIGYSAYTDTDDKKNRGDCHVQNGETEASVVRELYQYASYPNVKTEWPIRVLFAVFGSLSAGAIIQPSDGWIRITVITMVIILLVQIYSAGFSHVHGDLQAQILRDTTYCKYNVLLSQRQADPRHRSAQALPSQEEVMNGVVGEGETKHARAWQSSRPSTPERIP